MSMFLSLPVELLEYVIELAVAVPDLRNALPPQYAHYPEHALPLREIKLSAATLFSLTLVCKQWNAIYTPTLYRCLAIVDTTPIEALLHTLEHSRATAAISGRFPPLGSLTRHLIIALSDYPAHENDIERLVNRVVRRFGNLERLARYLPHIQILSISIITQDLFGLPLPYYGKNFATVITETCAQSLRELHLHRNPLVLFSRQELRKLLQSTPNLVALTDPSVGGYIGCPAALPHLPKLKHLTVDGEAQTCDGAGHADDRTPSLDHIHINPSRPSNFWVHLLSAQGGKLTSVSLDLRESRGAESCSECLSMLTNLCHNISYLEICIYSWRHFPRLDQLPPVAHLGIHPQSGDMSVVAICEALATLQSPSLKVVRLMNANAFEWFASPLSNNVESAWSPLAGRTFRVVDGDGRVLGPPGRSS